jgi:arsenate reductase
MAEGWARVLKSEEIVARSAGLRADGLDPRAVRVMAEAGVDIAAQRSKTVDEFADDVFDCVVTVCSDADARCPRFPGATRVVHVGFDDPPRLARTAAGESAALGHYRRVRDEIRGFVESLPAALEL